MGLGNVHRQAGRSAGTETQAADIKAPVVSFHLPFM